MKEETAKIEEFCPRAEIAAYIDGELSPREELDLEKHFAACATCAHELNEQKKLLCALDFALEDKDEIELPENFTKVVVTNAESKVKGLRCPRERNRALFVCIALFLLVVVGLGAETSKTVATFGAIGEQFVAVGAFFAHLVHDMTIAATIILRSLCLQFVFKSTIAAVGLGIFFVFSLLMLSRLIMRHNRFRN
jgi:anti-sigma factor RsiW